MFFKEWEVLLVDDEPDVLQVSRLAMRHFEVYGLPLRLHTAKSKALASTCRLSPYEAIAARFRTGNLRHEKIQPPPV